jgi:hypothetical protein
MGRSSRVPRDHKSTRLRSGALRLRGCSARSTTRSMFYLVLPAPTLTAGLPNLRCLYRTALAFRPPRLRIWRSAGRAGGAAHWGSVPVGHGCRGGGRSCCRLSSVAAAAVSPMPCGGRGCPQCRACRLPVFTRPRPVSRHPDSRSLLAASTWPVDQRRQANPTCPVPPWRRNGGCGSAGVLLQPDTAAGVWVAVEPDTVDALAVRCCSRNRGRCPEDRCPEGWCLDGWCLDG